jgi:hypothetical protein
MLTYGSGDGLCFGLDYEGVAEGFGRGDTRSGAVIIHNKDCRGVSKTE